MTLCSVSGSRLPPISPPRLLSPTRSPFLFPARSIAQGNGWCSGIHLQPCPVSAVCRQRGCHWAPFFCRAPRNNPEALSEAPHRKPSRTSCTLLSALPLLIYCVRASSKAPRALNRPCTWMAFSPGARLLGSTPSPTVSSIDWLQLSGLHPSAGIGSTIRHLLGL